MFVVVRSGLVVAQWSLADYWLRDHGYELLRAIDRLQDGLKLAHSHSPKRLGQHPQPFVRMRNHQGHTDFRSSSFSMKLGHLDLVATKNVGELQ